MRIGNQNKKIFKDFRTILRTVHTFVIIAKTSTTVKFLVTSFWFIAEPNSIRVFCGLTITKVYKTIK